jgi:hypothetical protein
MIDDLEKGNVKGKCSVLENFVKEHPEDDIFSHRISIHKYFSAFVIRKGVREHYLSDRIIMCKAKSDNKWNVFFETSEKYTLSESKLLEKESTINKRNYIAKK